jgi:tetratricopeptide (TPR) repeat protein
MPVQLSSQYLKNLTGLITNIMDYPNETFLKKYQNILVCLCIIAATFVVYIPAMKGGFIWDDPTHVTENPLLKNRDGLRKIWIEPGAWPQYYPLLLTSFWVEYQLWGPAPFPYHFTNVLLHALNAILLLHILRILKVPGALMAAAIFALHPVHVESVAWISERKNVLSGFFYLSALISYLHLSIVDDGSEKVSTGSGENRFDPDINNHKWLYLLSIVLFTSALLSKTVTCSLPAVILLLLWWKNGRIGRRHIQKLTPMFIIGLILGLNTIYMEKFSAGTQGADWAMSFVDRILVAGRALWFYAGKLLLPYKLTFIYPKWQINPTVWWQYLFPLTVIIILAAFWVLRKRIGKAPIVATLLFSGTLLPALGFFDLYPHRYSFVADHFQYLASISLIALAVSSVTNIFVKLDKKSRKIGFSAGLAFLVTIGVLSWKQGHIYQDLETLYGDIIAKNPQCWMAYNNLGLVLYEQHRVDEAIAQYVEAIRVKPDFVEVYNNLGLALYNQGRIDEAISQYLEALRINPNYDKAHNNLGLVLDNQGRSQEAIVHFLKALRIKPDYEEAHNNLGISLYKQGRTDEAIAQYIEAIRIKPDYEEAYNNLGISLYRKGNVEKAIESFRKAIQINPDLATARNNLNTALSLQNRYQ